MRTHEVERSGKKTNLSNSLSDRKSRGQENSAQHRQADPPLAATD
jgi:hypothetical protein